MNEWIEIDIVTTTEAVEAITNILYETGANGAIIEDPKDFMYQERKPLDWDYVEEDVFQTDPDADVIITTYLSVEKNVPEFIETIKQRIDSLKDFGLDIGKADIDIKKVDEADWANNWKAYYKPTKIGKKIVVKPTWEDYKKAPEDLIIELDPGMAFGTGTHETTSMCIVELENYVQEDSTVFDIGCGSGILGIAAAKLGAKKVVEVDLDEVAVKVSKENVLKNEVKNTVEVLHGDLVDMVDGKADVVVANIIADIIKILAKDIANFMNEDAVFISSGIILDKVDEVQASLIENGFEIIKVNRKGEWAAIVSKVKN
ncbi:MAG: 50S ribosomal protein L11 methyltransferase [Clostridioides sp.]|jgi:ribosomal protein L11 methyltransferase|nr:50S ribosomal protein L11 methyltransferase [Clostridioides sp.]